jgi:hypothetical protein
VPLLITVTLEDPPRVQPDGNEAQLAGVAGVAGVWPEQADAAVIWLEAAANALM